MLCLAGASAAFPEVRLSNLLEYLVPGRKSVFLTSPWWQRELEQCVGWWLTKLKIKVRKEWNRFCSIIRIWTIRAPFYFLFFFFPFLFLCFLPEADRSLLQQLCFVFFPTWSCSQSIYCCCFTFHQLGLLRTQWALVWRAKYFLVCFSVCNLNTDTYTTRASSLPEEKSVYCIKVLAHVLITGLFNLYRGMTKVLISRNNIPSCLYVIISCNLWWKYWGFVARVPNPVLSVTSALEENHWLLWAASHPFVSGGLAVDFCTILFSPNHCRLMYKFSSAGEGKGVLKWKFENKSFIELFLSLKKKILSLNGLFQRMKKIT